MALAPLLFFVTIAGVRSLNVQNVELPAFSFDPMNSQVHQSLLRALGVDAMIVRPLSENVGMNGGVWIVRDPRGRWPDMVMKSRLPERQLAPDFLPEPEHFMKLARELPSLATDPSVVFPSNILRCFGPGGAKITDLILMRKAPGAPFGNFIADMFQKGPKGERDLNAMFEKVGRQLRRFHDAYGRQHTDFQTSNIMVDKADGTVTFIDLGMMGQPTGEGDIYRLGQTIRMMAPLYNPSLLAGSMSHLEKGYREVALAPTMPGYGYGVYGVSTVSIPRSVRESPGHRAKAHSQNVPLAAIEAMVTNPHGQYSMSQWFEGRVQAMEQNAPWGAVGLPAMALWGIANQHGRN